MAIKILGIYTSPRHTNSEIMVKAALEVTKGINVEVEIEFVSLAGKNILGCTNAATVLRRAIVF